MILFFYHRASVVTMAEKSADSSKSSQTLRAACVAVPTINEHAFDNDAAVPFIKFKTTMLIFLVSMGGVCLG